MAYLERTDLDKSCVAYIKHCPSRISFIVSTKLILQRSGLLVVTDVARTSQRKFSYSPSSAVGRGHHGKIKKVHSWLRQTPLHPHPTPCLPQNNSDTQSVTRVTHCKPLITLAALSSCTAEIQKTACTPQTNRKLSRVINKMYSSLSRNVFKEETFLPF